MESKVAYRVASNPNPTGIPKRWLRALYRFAGLKGGRVYNVLISVPEKHDQPITWTFLGDGKEENGG